MYHIERLVRIPGTQDYIWRPVHPVGGATYVFKSLREAERNLSFCYDVDPAGLRITQLIDHTPLIEVGSK